MPAMMYSKKKKYSEYEIYMRYKSQASQIIQNKTNDCFAFICVAPLFLVKAQPNASDPTYQANQEAIVIFIFSSNNNVNRTYAITENIAPVANDTVNAYSNSFFISEYL